MSSKKHIFSERHARYGAAPQAFLWNKAHAEFPALQRIHASGLDSTDYHWMVLGEGLLA